MGLIQKKDEKEELDDIEIIGVGEGSDGGDEPPVELHEGLTAEDISGTTAARNADVETEADPELLEEIEDEFDEDDEDGVADGDGGNGSKRFKLLLAGAVVAVIAAAIIGYFVGSGGFGAKGVGSSTLTEDQLDTTVATWTYKGATHNVSAREAIESQYSLDAVKNDDDTYPAPAADTLLSYVRNQVMSMTAESQGLEVSDDEIESYAEQTIGTSDFEQIAENYGVSEDQAKEIVRQSALVKKLYDQVVPEAPAAPEAPAEPASDNADEATADYAAYIIGLAGDEWDADAGTWASTDGAIASALADSGFTGETATYTQAQTAYYAAYQQYATESSEATETWTSYANTLFASVDITIYGLTA